MRGGPCAAHAVFRHPSLHSNTFLTVAFVIYQLYYVRYWCEIVATRQTYSIVTIMGATQSSANTVTNTIIPDLATLNPAEVSYGRQVVWGDKLLRRLTPDQVSRYIVHQLAIKTARRASKSDTSQTATTTDVSDDVYQRGNKWVVPGVGEFANKAVYTFTGTMLPSGLTASNNDEQQGTAPYPFRFDAANVTVNDGTLNLKVAGGQDGRKRPISCAEVTTDENAILHASVRMTAQMSGQSGVCHDPNSTSNRVNPNATQFWYSNQATTQGGKPSHSSAAPPPSVEDFHTYRLDWTPDFTAYYVDGKLQSKLTENIPNKSGLWVWNNWSNGDPGRCPYEGIEYKLTLHEILGWSCGPPKNDSIFRIQDITMYYNTLAQ
ncbi:hypothetical protein Dsin_032978 [Dipteronia sinensis]|uniref:GH16 domain-containing protein n=1 Tax=Dipteronia sinensis TaxID=43782 RepID=A0AAE0DL76_9ROSI|nr:hypothetical protein Dsin_032978 [Dipteronia sinensis]